MLLKHHISQLVQESVEKAQHLGLIPHFSIPEIQMERPQSTEHGDFATSLPLKLARVAQMNPLAIAESITPLIKVEDFIGLVEIANPGFINFSISDDWLRQQVNHILSQSYSYGNLDLGRDRKIQLEFVSVNPTGPLHVGHTRGAVLGSALAEILRAAGYDVSSEYYINDVGTQMDSFAQTLNARYLQEIGRDAEIPPDGYVGSYMVDLARAIVKVEKDRFSELTESERISTLKSIGLQMMLKSIREDLDRIKVEFDVWFSEQSLYDSHHYDEVMEILREGGYLIERDGAIWFNSISLGEEKDNVLIRSTGNPTYFASDVAYHYNKFIKRHYDRVIDIWGADHQGHISRMKAVLRALDLDPDRLSILISQMVALKRDGETVRVSKRSGDLITLKDLVDEVGPDACRFFFLSRSADSQMDFDLELAKKDSDDNPVYYIQYAYARIAGIMRLAEENGFKHDKGNVDLLTHGSEMALIRKMFLLPEVIEGIAISLEPHHLPRYTVELATAFHLFYQQCRVVSKDPEDKPITEARLKLTEACRVVLERCLFLMGMNAPDRM